MTGPFGADAAAEWMWSIVMQAPGPAGRAGGVARLCATPFAAGQALAVRRRPPATDRACCIAFTGAQPHANWGALAADALRESCDSDPAAVVMTAALAVAHCREEGPYLPRGP